MPRAKQSAANPRPVVVKFARPPQPAPPKPRAFEHPEHSPDVDDMLDEVAACHDRLFGPLRGTLTGWQLAARTECDLYNAWVILHCRTHGLLEPGELTADQFARRFWAQPATGGAR